MVALDRGMSVHPATCDSPLRGNCGVPSFLAAFIAVSDSLCATVELSLGTVATRLNQLRELELTLEQSFVSSRIQSGSLNRRRLLAVACAASVATSTPFNSATVLATKGSSAGSL